MLVDAPQVLRVQPGGDALSPRPAGAVMPAVQAAAVAAGGFVAGAAVVGLVQRRSAARGALARAPARPSGETRSRSRRSAATATARRAELVQIVGSRSLLVDVHLLGGPEASLRRR